MSENKNNASMPNRPPRGPGRGGPGAILEKPNDFGGAIKKLFKFLKPYYGIIIVSLVLASCASICNIVAPGILSDLTNEITNSARLAKQIDMNAIAKYGGILIALYVGNASLNFIQSFMMAGVTQGVAKRFRTSISKKINVVPLNYFDKRSYGDTLSRVTNDVDTIAHRVPNSIYVVSYPR